MTSGLDFSTSTQVFRKDNRIIIASNRHLATIVPVRLAYDALGYNVGQCLSRNSVSGLWSKYVAAGSSGTDAVVGILFDDVLDMTSPNTDMARMIVGGNVFYDLCTDIDANGVADLNGRTVVDSLGNTILMF
jgi:hypothetical protein